VSLVWPVARPDSVDLLKTNTDFAPVFKFEDSRVLVFSIPLVVDFFALQPELQAIQNQFVVSHWLLRGSSIRWMIPLYGVSNQFEPHSPNWFLLCLLIFWLYALQFARHAVSIPDIHKLSLVSR
jgi:hypothetical protein